MAFRGAAEAAPCRASRPPHCGARTTAAARPPLPSRHSRYRHRTLTILPVISRLKRRLSGLATLTFVALLFRLPPIIRDDDAAFDVRHARRPATAMPVPFHAGSARRFIYFRA